MQATVRRAAMSVRPFAMVCAVALAVCTAADWAAGNTRPAPGSADGDGLVTSAPQILVIFSDDPSQSWTRDLTDALIGTEYGLKRLSPAWYFEHLDAVRFQELDRQRHFRDMLLAKYRNRNLDLIVAVASSAIEIDRKQRGREHDARALYEQLTPREREVFAHFDQRTAQ
jgi:hypothetical protein